MEIRTLEDLFIDELRDIYDAEHRILEGIEKMEEAALNEELKEAFRTHHEETQGQIDRLEQVFEICEKSPEGEECQAIRGHIEEADELIDNIEDAEVCDAALIAAAQKIEHYEIAAYGTLCTLGKMLGKDECADLLKETLEEEKNTDKRLSALALDKINERAAA